MTLGDIAEDWTSDPANMLAIPPGDVKKWRRRMDVSAVGYVALDNAWIADQRYQKLVTLCRLRRVPAVQVFACLSLTAFELIRNGSMPGVAKLGVEFPTVVLRTWGFDDDDRSVFSQSMHLGIQVALLVRVNTENQDAISAYACVRARTRAGTGDTRAGPPSSSSINKSLTTTSTSSGSAAPGLVLFRKRPDGSPPIYGSNDDPQAAFELLGKVIADRRRELGKSVYPATSADYRDLRHAVKSACEMGKLAELVEELKGVTGWANNGAGFKDAMRKAGFL